MYQFNYYINTMCNQHCNYCYARAQMDWNKIKPFNEILEDVNKFKLFEKSIISLIGGEPTLHPKFNDILKEFSETHHNLHVYTNGTTNFSKINLEYAKNFLWTFSYHGKFTKDGFFENLIYFIDNNISINLTIIAQNVDDKIIDFCKKYKIETVITFIHNSINFKNSIDVKNNVHNISYENIKNYSEFYNKDLIYTGMKCYYSEINIINNFIISHECNLGLKMEFTTENLLSIENFKPKICKREMCIKDCAFIIPKKEL